MRALLVGDDPLARTGLANLLGELEVVAQISADSAEAAYRAHQPEAVIWDLGWILEESSWRDQLSDLVEAGAAVVTLIPDRSQALEAWSAGARGLLGRDVSKEQVVAALTAVSRGLVAVDPALQGALLPSHEGLNQTVVERLTERELEVLRLLAEGLSNRSIAYRLEISEHTVKFHVNAILRKLGAQSRTEAVVRATRSGLILL